MKTWDKVAISAFAVIAIWRIYLVVAAFLCY